MFSELRHHGMQKGILNSVVLVVLLLSFLTGSVPAVYAQGSQTSTLASLVLPAAAKVIPGQYIVVYKSGVITANAIGVDTAAIQALGGKVMFVYGTALQGYAAQLPPQALDAARRSPLVDYVEADQVYSINDGEIGTEAVQAGATWGLDRIDQRNEPLNSSYTYNTAAGNVNVYVIDTGIRITHTQFGGRATWNANFSGDGINSDCHGHGTHVAGTIGSTTYGVAKAVKLHAVKVLDCAGSGSLSGVIAGINWVAAHRVKPAVANMSLGGGFSASINTAVTNAISAGVTFAVAAGNDSLNACNYSPASTPAAITVGSTTSTDARSSFSNIGSCLDIFAPGTNITSTWNTSNTATNTISGTSMATPHVAGVAALYLAAHPSAAPSAVANALIASSTANKVLGPGAGSPNRLLYSLLTVNVITVPTALTPAGTLADTTPTFTWTKVNGATQYQFAVYTGAALAYPMKTVPAGACGAVVGKCSNTPANVLGAGAHTWKVRALIGGIWKPFSALKAFTIGAVSTKPRAGYWASNTADEFYVIPAQTRVRNFAIYINACSITWKIYETALLPISNNHFAFSGPFHGSGTFSTTTRASGQDGLTSYLLPGCGTITASWTYNPATWRNTTQPSAVSVDPAGILFLKLGPPDPALPSPYHTVKIVAP